MEHTEQIKPSICTLDYVVTYGERNGAHYLVETANERPMYHGGMASDESFWRALSYHKPVDGQTFGSSIWDGNNHTSVRHN